MIYIHIYIYICIYQTIAIGGMRAGGHSVCLLFAHRLHGLFDRGTVRSTVGRYAVPLGR